MSYDIWFSILISFSFLGIILMVYLFYVGKEISNSVNRSDELQMRVVNSRKRIEELLENQKNNSFEQPWFKTWYDSMNVEEYVETTSECAKCPIGHQRMLNNLTILEKKHKNTRIQN